MVRLISTIGFRGNSAFSFLWDNGLELAADGWPAPSSDPQDFDHIVITATDPTSILVEPFDGGKLLTQGEYPW